MGKYPGKLRPHYAEASEKTRRHKAETRGTLRVYVCADCHAQGCTLFRCADGLLRCRPHTQAFNRLLEQARLEAAAAARHAPSVIAPAGQLVTPPRREVACGG